MEKLEWHFVEELGSLEPMSLAKTCGVVLSVSIETTFLSFTSKSTQIQSVIPRIPSRSHFMRMNEFTA